jgi:hypothetical protein
MKSSKILTATLSLALAACGGGGGGGGSTSTSTSTTEPPLTPTPIVTQNVGLWRGTTSTGRSQSLILFEDGRAYQLYSAVSDAATTGGVIIGSASGTASSLNLRAVDFSREGHASAMTTIAGTLDGTGNYNGSATYDVDASRNFSFTSSYRPPTAQVISMADVTGAYAGTDRTTVLTIRADGLMRGVAFSPDCAFIGSIAPTRNYTTLMQMSLTFQGGACTFGTQTLEGIAIYDPTLRTLQGVALVDTGTRVALLLARKS